jgi:phage head maturation protease
MITTTAALRQTDDGKSIGGLAAPFNKPADIGGEFTETIRRGAFSRTLKEQPVGLRQDSVRKR